MGQAKQRGTKEERVHAALEIKQEAERQAKVLREAREQRRAEQRTKDVVVVGDSFHSRHQCRLLLAALALSSGLSYNPKEL